MFARINLIYILYSLSILVGVLLSVAFYTVAERKIMASIQRRSGPAVVGFWGILQALADGFKLVLKETIYPLKANRIIFVLAPFITFLLALVQWVFIPLNSTIGSAEHLGGYTLLGILAVSSLAVYGIVLAGWSSNSRYTFLGALRSTSQMVSYEVLLGLLIAPIVIAGASFDLTEIVLIQKGYLWFIVPFWPLFLIFLVAMLAESNRSPFDLPEAEAEIVAGYNLEYSSLGFASFFLGEYSNMLVLSSMGTLLFLGGDTDPFCSSQSTIVWKLFVLAFFFVAVRATVPRYRWDQLLGVGWKALLPLIIGLLVTYCGIFYFEQW